MLYFALIMLTADALAYFGSKKAIADAIGVSPSAVSQWEELVPPLSAAKLEKASDGRLKFDPDLYDDWNRQEPSSQERRANH